MRGCATDGRTAETTCTLPAHEKYTGQETFKIKGEVTTLGNRLRCMNLTLGLGVTWQGDTTDQGNRREHKTQGQEINKHGKRYLKTRRQN